MPPHPHRRPSLPKPKPPQGGLLLLPPHHPPPIPKAELDARQARQARRAAFDLPIPEDRSAIQASIGEILRRLAANQLDPRRAGLLLYGLQIASINLPPRQPARDPAETVEEVILDPNHGLIAPEQDFNHRPNREKTLEDILLEDWAREEAREAQARPAIPISIDSLQAVADKDPGPSLSLAKKANGQEILCVLSFCSVSSVIRFRICEPISEVKSRPNPNLMKTLHPFCRGGGHPGKPAQTLV